MGKKQEADNFWKKLTWGIHVEKQHQMEHQMEKDFNANAIFQWLVVIMKMEMHLKNNS